MSCTVVPDCSGFPHNCPLSAPDSDVAGIGVVWGFGVTSFVTVALSAPMALLGLIDLVVGRSPRLRWLARKLRLDTPEQHSGWIDNLVHIIIGLSDQQLVTGLAILVVGFSKHCSLSSMHFWVIFDLAWFSSVTHLASLPVLNYYLRNYPRWRDFRVALMLANFGLLIAAAIMTFGNYDPASHDCPIQCSFDRFQSSDFPPSKIHITQMVFVTFGFIWALVHLYAPTEIWRMRHRMIVDRGFGNGISDLRLYIENRKRHLSMVGSHTTAKDIFDDAMHFRHTRYIFYDFFYTFHKKHEDSTVYLVFRWIMLMLFAPPSAIIWANLVSMWIMGVVRLGQDRRWSVPEENEWGFGQVLPLLLLVLPFFTVTEVTQEFMNKPNFQSINADQLISTAYDPDSYQDTALAIKRNTEETTQHVKHVEPAKLAHHPTEPSRTGVNVDSSPELPKRSLTSPSAFGLSKQIIPQSPPLTSPPLPSPMTRLPTNRAGYSSLPDEEWDTERPIRISTSGPLDDSNIRSNRM